MYQQMSGVHPQRVLNCRTREDGTLDLLVQFANDYGTDEKWIEECKVERTAVVEQFLQHHRQKMADDTANKFGKKKLLSKVQIDEIMSSCYPEKILGASIEAGELLFLIKFKSLKQPVIVPIKDFRYKFPEMLIDYFTSKVQWTD
ncbi:hypothetical protein SNEBB_004803 [Seison nebaliae]|nr:hypothetical protein SNEBB_004803 [Seison nebaliae]